MEKVVPAQSPEQAEQDLSTSLGVTACPQYLWKD